MAVCPHHSRPCYLFGFYLKQFQRSQKCHHVAHDDMQSSLVGTSLVVTGCSLACGAGFEGLTHTWGHGVSLTWHDKRWRLVEQIPLFHVRLFRTLLPTWQSLLLPFPQPSPSYPPIPKIQSSFAIFSPPSPILFPWELSASPHHAPYFSHHIQPVPALWHLSTFPFFPRQDHSNTLWLLLILLCYSAHPQGTAQWLL